MEKAIKCIIIAILIIIYLITDEINTGNALLIHFHHANIFHLTANVWSIYIIRKADWITSYITAVICAFPFADTTIGFSGVISAALGIMYGKYPSKKFLVATGVAIITGILPNINATFHVVCMLTGFIAGFIYQNTKSYVGHRN